MSPLQVSLCTGWHKKIAFFLLEQGADVNYIAERKLCSDGYPVLFENEKQKMKENETFVFTALPSNTEELKVLPEASLDTPFKTASLTVCALCTYAENKEKGLEMLNFLRGPRPMNGMEISFINDRFRGGKTYIPFSYFGGATPDNNYVPNKPYKIIVESNNTSREENGYMKLFISSSGADSPRPIKLRVRNSDGKWFLWEQYLLTAIREPRALDPWA